MCTGSLCTPDCTSYVGPADKDNGESSENPLRSKTTSTTENATTATTATTTNGGDQYSRLVSNLTTLKTDRDLEQVG